MANSTITAEYTDWIYVKRKDFPIECPRYDSKQSDGETPVIMELWERWSSL